MERRQFLKLAGYGLGLSLLHPIIKGAERAGENYSRELATSRDAIPLQRTRRPNSLIFGFAPHNNDIKRVKAFDDYNSTVQVINIFPSWKSNDWGGHRARKIQEMGKIPVISINPWDNSQFNIFDFEKQELMIREKMVLFAYLDNVIFRFGYEMNGNWVPCDKPDPYVAAYKRFMDIAKDINPQVRSLWSPNVTNYARDFEPYYPGDEYVDLVGLDGYDTWHENILRPNHYYQPNLSFRQLFGKDVAALQTLAPSKPIIISELGSARGRGAADWMGGALEEVKSWKNVNGLCIFGWNKAGTFISEANWDITSKPEMMDIVSDALNTGDEYSTESSLANTMEILMNVE